MSGWEALNWGDLATLEYGKGLRDYQDAEGEIPVYGTNGAVGWTDKPLCRTPGVIIGRKGAYRGVHFSESPFFVIDTAFYLKPKRNLNIRWAYYQLLTQDINGMDSGSAIPSTSRDEFYHLPVFIPPRAEQDRIADILKTLDDKIALNRKLNQTLEGMARALFQSWFVDFDPVKAKFAAKKVLRARQQTPSPQPPLPEGEGLIEGEHPYMTKACMAALSGKLRIAPGRPKLGTPTSPSASVKEKADGDVGAPRGLPTADELDAAIAELDSLNPSQKENLCQTAAHFPAAFQESELGLVPEGWEVVSSDAHLDVARGFSYKGAGLSDCGTPMHNLNSVYEGGGYKYEGIKYYTLPFKDKHKILPGDVIVTNTEQGFDHLLIGFGAMVPESFPVGIFSHHIYRVRPLSSSSLTNHFIYHLFLPGRFRSAIAGFSNGTTVNMLPVDGLTKQLLCIPPTGLISDFTAQSRSLRKEQEKLHHQSRTLAELRDTLLPKLLSGELSVGEMKETMEALA